MVRETLYHQVFQQKKVRQRARIQKFVMGLEAVAAVPMYGGAKHKMI